MFRIIDRTLYSKKYQQQIVQYPRCDLCAEKQEKRKSMFLFVFLVFCIFSAGIGYYEKALFGSLAGLFLGAIAFLLASGPIIWFLETIVLGLRSESDISVIKEMERNGWKIGDQPAKYD